MIDTVPHRYTMVINHIDDGTGTTLFSLDGADEVDLPFERATWIEFDESVTEEPILMPHRWGKVERVEDQRPGGLSPELRKVYTLSRRKPVWMQPPHDAGHQLFFLEIEAGNYQPVLSVPLSDRRPRPKERLILPSSVANQYGLWEPRGPIAQAADPVPGRRGDALRAPSFHRARVGVDSTDSKGLSSGHRYFPL